MHHHWKKKKKFSFPQFISGSNFFTIHLTFESILFLTAASAAAKSLQSYPTLCDPIDGSPPGSPIPGILQARTLEWIAISFSNAWKWKVKVKSLSRVQLLATPWTAAYQAPLSLGFSRQEYWSGVPLPSPSFSLPNPRSKFSLFWTACIPFLPSYCTFNSTYHSPHLPQFCQFYITHTHIHSKKKPKTKPAKTTLS